MLISFSHRIRGKILVLFGSIVCPERKRDEKCLGLIDSMCIFVWQSLLKITLLLNTPIRSVEDFLLSENQGLNLNFELQCSIRAG